jgi:hypothetical protein
MFQHVLRILLKALSLRRRTRPLRMLILRAGELIPAPDADPDRLIAWVIGLRGDTK